MKRPVVVLAVVLGLVVLLFAAHSLPRRYGPAGPWGYGMMGSYGTGPDMTAGYAMGPGTMGGYGVNPGMMSRYTTGPGMMSGYGVGPGMPMGPGMMGGYGMGPGMMMRPGMMGSFGMGPGMMMGPQCFGSQALDLSTEDVTNYFQRWLAWQGNPRLTLGTVSERDDDTISVDIVTTEGSVLVQRFNVNRHTGATSSDQG